MSNNDTPVIVTRDITFAMTAMGLAHEAGLSYLIIRLAKQMIAVFVDDLQDREGFVRAVKEKHNELHATAKSVKEYEESKAAATASEELAKILRTHY